MSGPSLGLLFSALAAIGFSAKAVFVKLAYHDPVDPVTLLALRMALSMPFFMAAAWFSGKPALAGRDWAAVIALGILGYYLASLLDFLGLQHVSAGIERLVLFLYPTLVVLISAAVSRRALQGREVASIALSYAGIALVFFKAVGSGGDPSLGTLLVFGSALSYALYLVGAGQVMARIGMTRFTSYASLVSCFAILIQFAATRPLAALDLPLRVYGIALGMALFSTVAPFFLLSAGIRLIGAGRAALVGSLGPVATIGLAHIFLGEAFTAWQAAGSLLVLAGVLSISLGRRSG